MLGLKVIVRVQLLPGARVAEQSSVSRVVALGHRFADECYRLRIRQRRVIKDRNCHRSTGLPFCLRPKIQPPRQETSSRDSAGSPLTPPENVRVLSISQSVVTAPEH